MTVRDSDLAWRVAGAAALVHTVQSVFYQHTPTVLMPLILHSFNASIVRASAVVALGRLSFVAALPLGGIVVDRFGPSPCIVLGVSALALSSLLFSRMDSMVQFSVLQVVNALAMSVSGVPVYAVLLCRFFSTFLGLAMGLVLAGFSLAGASAPLVLGAIASHNNRSWRAAAATVSVLLWAVALPLAIWLRRATTNAHAHDDGGSGGERAVEGATPAPAMTTSATSAGGESNATGRTRASVAADDAEIDEGADGALAAHALAPRRQWRRQRRRQQWSWVGPLARTEATNARLTSVPEEGDNATAAAAETSVRVPPAPTASCATDARSNGVHEYHWRRDGDHGDGGDNAGVAEPARSPFLQPGFLLLVPCYFFLQYGFGSFNEHLLIFLTGDDDFSLHAAAVFLSVLYLCTFLAKIAGGYLGDRFDRARVAMYAAAMALLGALFLFTPDGGASASSPSPSAPFDIAGVAPLATSRAALFAFSSVFGFGYGATFNALYGIVPFVLGTAKLGLVQSALFAAGLCGNAVGALASGYLRTRTGSYHESFLVALAAVALNFVFVFTLARLTSIMRVQMGGARAAAVATAAKEAAAPSVWDEPPAQPPSEYERIGGGSGKDEERALAGARIATGYATLPLEEEEGEEEEEEDALAFMRNMFVFDEHHMPRNLSPPFFSRNLHALCTPPSSPTRSTSPVTRRSHHRFGGAAGSGMRRSVTLADALGHVLRGGDGGGGSGGYSDEMSPLLEAASRRTPPSPTAASSTGHV